MKSHSNMSLGLLVVVFFSILVPSGRIMASIRIVNFACCEFTPSDFSASVGDTVVWQGDFTKHPLQSTTIPAGAAPFTQTVGTSFSYVIQVAGDYDYQCNIHQPFMVGGFTVTLAGVENQNIPSLGLFTLYQNFPNPFNPVTVISFYMRTAQSVTIKVFDLSGNEITTLAEGKKSIGIHEVQFDGSGLSSGMYLYSLDAGSLRDVKKFLLIK